MNHSFQSISTKCDEVVKLTGNFFDNLKKLNLGNKDNLMLEICSIGLFVKAFRLLRGIQVLCKEELNNEAHALLRVLAETFLTLAVIYKEETERKNRAKGLLAYQRIVIIKAVSAFHENPNLGGIPENIRDELAQQAKEIEEEYGSQSYSEMRKNKKIWKGMFRMKKCEGIKEVMDYVGLNNTYDSLYREGSRNVHADDFFDYLRWTNDNDIVLMEKDPKGVGGILALSSFFMLDLMNILSDSVKNWALLKPKVDELKGKIQQEFDKLNASGQPS